MEIIKKGLSATEIYEKEKQKYCPNCGKLASKGYYRNDSGIFIDRIFIIYECSRCGCEWKVLDSVEENFGII